MAEIGIKGEQLDLLIRQGATFGPFSMVIADGGGNPTDITNMQFRGQIRKTFDDIDVDAQFSFELIDAVNGQLEFSINAGQTELLGAGIDENAPESQYVYDIESEDQDGIVYPIVYGNVRVFREVTR